MGQQTPRVCAVQRTLAQRERTTPTANPSQRSALGQLQKASWHLKSDASFSLTVRSQVTAGAERLAAYRQMDLKAVDFAT